MFSVSLSMLRRLLEEKVSLRAELCQVEEQIQIAEYQISALQNTWYNRPGACLLSLGRPEASLSLLSISSTVRLEHYKLVSLRGPLRGWGHSKLSQHHFVIWTINRRYSPIWHWASGNIATEIVLTTNVPHWNVYVRDSWEDSCL